ncbi:hypothetical protein CMO90_00615 [Candidatus Woesearchaeota archaeon]|jgi:nucleolar protein 56|nr:hypothetical protein [Candidatus Woesearchaeota archaeon]|tara:strand:- start:1761 stop:2495 length:735 start_codon:yes stop_codon:yes gene_type:complete
MVDFKKLRINNILLAKKTIREAVCEDDFIINSINNIEDLAKVANVLCKRLRQWYSLYLPEMYNKIGDNEAFVRLVLKKDKNTLMKELKLSETMGSDLSKNNLKPILALASRIDSLYTLRNELKDYLKKIMGVYCKNLLTLAGTVLGAKLIESGGSLKKLALMPSSTIQMLGAEKALFRHLKSGARPPKHGIILQHPLVGGAPKNKKGKAARLLADKLSIAIRTDFFKGEFIGNKLKEELKKRLK